MARYLVSLLLCMQLLLAHAETLPAIKSPLNYSLREYGLIIGIAMLGGFVRWYAAVRRGEAAAYDIRVLVGELMTSAFIGILVFWACEAYNVAPLVTAAMSGMAGHAGITALVWAERTLQRFFERKYGLVPTDRAPLGKE